MARIKKLAVAPGNDPDGERIARIYQEVGAGRMINITGLPTIFEAGRLAIARGCTECPEGTNGCDGKIGHNELRDVIDEAIKKVEVF